MKLLNIPLMIFFFIAMISCNNTDDNNGAYTVHILNSYSYDIDIQFKRNNISINEDETIQAGEEKTFTNFAPSTGISEQIEVLEGGSVHNGNLILIATSEAFIPLPGETYYWVAGELTVSSGGYMVTKYSCINNNCLSDSEGQYGSLSECQNMCGSSDGNRYDCINGNCEISTNGLHGSLSECQTACTSAISCPSSVTDVEGNIYPVVQIGSQCWMAENLRTSKTRIRSSIYNASDSLEWYNVSIGGTAAWCYYKNNPEYNIPYGKMYNWNAIENGNLCPEGWHVPTYDEWQVMLKYLDPSSNGHFSNDNDVGGKLKLAGTEYWNPPNEGAINSVGFSAYPGGEVGGKYDIRFFGLGQYGAWWSSTNSTGSTSHPNGVFVSMHALNSKLNSASIGPKTYPRAVGLCVRCIKD